MYVLPVLDLDEGTWALREAYKRHYEAIAEAALSPKSEKRLRADAIGKTVDEWEDRLTELRNAAKKVPVG